jgi:putative SOS response-associated peptidase YedK
MCGRYRRKSDKQRIADTFEVTAGLDELDLGPDDDIASGSIQPVVSINQDGERKLELMRWDSNCPTVFSSMRGRKASSPQSSGRMPF